MRRLGQHFLTRGTVIHRILMSLQLTSEDHVLEIGPGKGALTLPLARKVGRLLLVEKDPILQEALLEKFSNQKNVEVWSGDFLTTPWETVTECLGKNFKIVSNLPYRVGTAILTRLLNEATPGTLMVLMFQKEVADRLLATPRTKDFGSLTVFAQVVAHIRRLFDVPPEAFHPPPKVFSTVLQFRLRSTPLVAKAEWPRFEALLHSGFRQRRKMLRQNLKSYFRGEEAPAIEARLTALGASPQARAEELAVEQWVRLFGASAGAFS